MVECRNIKYSNLCKVQLSTCWRRHCEAVNELDMREYYDLRNVKKKCRGWGGSLYIGYDH